MSYKKITTPVSNIDPSSGNTQTIDRNGHADVVLHTHPEGGCIHLVTGDLTVDTDFILIDLSDTTNYPHENTTAIHVGWILFSIDATINSSFSLRFGFIDNVDGTDGDFHEIHAINVGKGSPIPVFNLFPIAPDGVYAKAGKFLSSINDMNDTDFNTVTNLRTTISPLTAATPAGSGDLVLRLEVTTGTVQVNFDLNYHSH